MGAFVSESDIAYVQSLYPLMDIKPFTQQEEQFALNYLRGATVAVASRAAGYKSTHRARALLNDDAFLAVLSYLKERDLQDVRIDREVLTTMLLEAHSEAATAGEKIQAIKELGRLHAIYPEGKSNTTINQINIGEASKKQLERMSDDELLQHVPDAFKELMAPEKEIEAEIIES